MYDYAPRFRAPADVPAARRSWRNCRRSARRRADRLAIVSYPARASSDAI